MEAEVARFDTIFQEAEQECIASTEANRRIRVDLDQVKDQEKEIKGRSDEATKERHDLQVCLISTECFVCFRD